MNNEVRMLYLNFRKQGYRAAFIKQKIAEYCGVSPRSVDNWIFDHRMPRQSTLDKLKSFKIIQEES